MRMYAQFKKLEHQQLAQGKRTMSNQITVGTEIVAKVGRNEVEAIITKVTATELVAKSKRSGKEFNVKTILRILTPEEDPAEVAENPIPAQERSTAKAEKKKSLLTAAAELLQQTGEAFSTNELIAKIQEAGLWEPKEGKTPANTLYAAILREMNTKENSRFARGDKKGTFQYAL